MRRLYIEIILISFISLNIYAQRNRVQIKDGTLVTDSGTLLRGSHLATHDECRRDSTWVTHEYIKGLKSLGLNSVRAFTENPWVPETAGSRVTYVDSIVKWTRQENMYVIILWAGWTANETTHEDSIAHNFHKEFWSFYAQRYKDETHVIFEICNEPSDVGFDSLTIAMQLTAYDTIRKYAPETHILFMSPPAFYYYSEFLNDIENLGDGIDWSNASIAVHAYNWPAQDYNEPIRKIKNAGYALTITEFHSFMNEYANLALSRVFENEFVSYFHFLSAKRIIDDKTIFKSRVESSEFRWAPDFGTWPMNITEINYQNPYQYWPAIFYDEGLGWINLFVNEIITNISNNEYVAYYNIDFQAGPITFEACCSATASDGRIELRLDSLNGQLVGVCQLSSTGSLDNYETFTCNDITPFTGVHNLYLKFRRNDNSPMFNIRSWYFINSELSATQTPFHGSAIVIPGKIEAEEYDIGGSTISFLDTDTVNQGSFFRDDDVDIDSTRDGGYCIGWTEVCEWLEYTVSCQQNTAMDIQLRVTCTKPGYKFNVKLDNLLLAKASLPNTGGYHTWETITIEGIQIPAGENQILRIEFLDGYMNLDWLNFVVIEPSGFEEVKNNKSFTFYPNPAQDYFQVKTTGPVNVEIYSLQGQLLIKKKTSANDDIIPVINLTSGSYFIKAYTETEIYSEILIIE